MATRFVTVDRNTPMLFPPDLRDWIGEEGLVHFVIEALENRTTTVSNETIILAGLGMRNF